MINKTCSYCNNTFDFEKFQQFGAHKTNCKYNPKFKEIRKKASASNLKDKIKKELVCKKCKAIYIIEVTEKIFEDGNYKKHCSRNCANSKIHTNITKNKISKKITEYFLKKIKYSKIKYIECVICKTIKVLKYTSQRTTCCKKCNSKLISLKVKGKTGGMRNRGGNGKVGKYKGILCQSSWELAYVIYNIEHDIIFERNKKYFKYKFDNKTSKYYPDFIQDEYYIEIKGFKSDRTDAKINQFPYKIKILYGKEMKIYLDYVIDKYGKDFIKLYD